MPRKTKAERIASIPIEDIISEWGKEGGPEKVRGYLKTLQYGYKRRVGQFKRLDEFSYAQHAYEQSLKKTYINPKYFFARKNFDYNSIIKEIARLQSFFRAQSSDVKGLRKINLEQDIRLFGLDEQTGTPNITMTTSERKQFWKVYDKFMDQVEGASSKYGSNSVQQVLSDMQVDGDIPVSLENVNIPELLSKIEKKIIEKRDELYLGSVPNVYMGRGPFVP